MERPRFQVVAFTQYTYTRVRGKKPAHIHARFTLVPGSVRSASADRGPDAVDVVLHGVSFHFHPDHGGAGDVENAEGTAPPGCEGMSSRRRGPDEDLLARLVGGRCGARY